MKFLTSIWQGLTYEDGKFSGKRVGYDVGLVVSSYIVLRYNNISWDLLAVYLAYCTGPSSFREFLAFKSGKTPDKDDK